MNKSSINLRSKKLWIKVQFYLFISATVFVLLGTLFPIYAPLVNLNSVVLGPDFYNKLSIPIGTLLLLSLTLSLFAFGQKSAQLRFLEILRSHLGKINIALCVFVILIYTPITNALYAFILIPCSLLLILTILQRLYRNIINKVLIKDTASHIAHLGFAIMVLGMVIDSGFRQEKVFVLSEGKSFDFASYKLTYAGQNVIKDTVKTREIATLQVRDLDNKTIALLQPERHFFANHNMMTTKSAILTDGLSHLYVVTGGKNDQGDRLIMSTYHPLIILIWIGGLFMALGGIVLILRQRFFWRRYGSICKNKN